MKTKAKALYQVKLILDNLPEEEYKLIPKETIKYIEDNLEYDEDFSIDPNIPLEAQSIDNKAYEMLDKIINSVEKSSGKIYENVSGEDKAHIDDYIDQVREANQNYDVKIENVRLKNLVDLLQKENEKIPKAKDLLSEYKELLKQKEDEVERLKKNNQELYDCIQKLPKWVKKIFIKDYNIKLIDK